MKKDILECGVVKTMKIIGSKWTILILRDLFDGKKRFAELQHSLKTISPRTLSIRLQQLEKDGIINKKIYAQVPLKVEYSLTKKGETLNEIIFKLREWGDKAL